MSGGSRSGPPFVANRIRRPRCVHAPGTWTGAAGQIMCRSLCPNWVIPARIGPCRTVLHYDARNTAEMPGVRMNTNVQCRSVSSGVLPSDFAR